MYLQCQNPCCQQIRAEGELPKEWIEGTIEFRAYCQDCGGEVFIQVTNVCTECERHFQVKGDDFCQHCLDAEKDALVDISADSLADRAKAVVRADRSAVLISISSAPPRRLSIGEEIDAFKRARRTA